MQLGSPTHGAGTSHTPTRFCPSLLDRSSKLLGAVSYPVPASSTGVDCLARSCAATRAALALALARASATLTAVILFALAARAVLAAASDTSSCLDAAVAPRWTASHVGGEPAMNETPSAASSTPRRAAPCGDAVASAQPFTLACGAGAAANPPVLGASVGVMRTAASSQPHSACIVCAARAAGSCIDAASSTEPIVAFMTSCGSSTPLSTARPERRYDSPASKSSIDASSTAENVTSIGAAAASLSATSAATTGSSSSTYSSSSSHAAAYSPSSPSSRSMVSARWRSDVP